MDGWAQLGRTAEARLSAFQRAREQRAIQERYRNWARRAPWGAIVALHAELMPWVESLGERAFPGSSPVAAEPGLALLKPYRVVHGELERWVTSLELGGSRVDVHAQWTPGTAPSVHLLRCRISSGRCGGFSTTQGAWLAPREDWAEAAPRFYSHTDDILISTTELAQHVARFACARPVWTGVPFV